MADDEPVDVKDQLEQVCALTPACYPMYKLLTECTLRVHARQKTSETCTQELFDLSVCVDKCMAPRLFAKLK